MNEGRSVLKKRLSAIRERSFFSRVLILWLEIALMAFSPDVINAQSLMTITGSSMLYPLEENWARSYEKSHPGTKVDVSATGSGMGYRQAFLGDVSIGASDAYETQNIKKQYPDMISIPVAMEDVEIVYNLPGISRKIPLRLDGKNLALIFLGKISYWDDKRLLAENPGLPLPHQKIEAIHRSDLSGTTFVLTDFLSRTSPEWRSQIGRDMSPHWPIGKGLNGSEGISMEVQRTPWSIGYEGHNWVKRSGLLSAALKNHDGYFVTGSVKTISNAGRNAIRSKPNSKNFDQSIVFWVPGKNVYPASNFEYWVVNPHLDSESMMEVRHLIHWVLESGQNPSIVESVGFAPVPMDSTRPLLRKLLRGLLPGSSFKVVSPG